MPKNIKRITPNQIFIGCPWKNVRAKYEKIIEKLKSAYPLYFVIVGRGEKQDAKDLLGHIEDRIASSSYAIFDATGGNANVSLEYGYAEALDVPRAIYISGHRASSKSDSAIITDLAGKKRNNYKQESGLMKLLRDFSKSHSFTKDFEDFLSKKGKTLGHAKTARAIILKILRKLDGVERIRRESMVQILVSENAKYRKALVEKAITALHKEGIVISGKGPYATICIKK